MVNRTIRRLILNKLRITKQALSQRAKRLKDTYGPMTTEEAVYVMAHLEGIDLSKHLSLSVLDRIRALVPRQTVPAPAMPSRQSQKKAKRPKPKQYTAYPLVSASEVNVANHLGSEVYPQVFILENSIRKLIKDRLSKLDKSWWDKLVPPDVQGNVARTMKREKRYTYREARGSHPLLYANFADLKKIIVTKQNVFSDVIIDIEWFKVKMDEVYMARNNLAHSVSLSRDDISRIALFHRDWARMLNAAGIR